MVRTGTLRTTIIGDPGGSGVATLQSHDGDRYVSVIHGRFEVDDLFPGDYEITYGSTTTHVTVVAGQTTEVTITVDRDD